MCWVLKLTGWLGWRESSCVPKPKCKLCRRKKKPLLPLFIAFNKTRLSLQYSDKWPDQKVPTGVAQCARKHDNHVLHWKGTIALNGALSVEKPHQSLLYGLIPEERTWWSGLSGTVPVEKTWCGVFYGGQWRKKRWSALCGDLSVEERRRSTHSVALPVKKM